MEITVSIVLRAKRRLTVNQLFDVAYFAATAGCPGRTRLEAIVTVDAADLFDAAHRAIDRVTALVPGTVTAVHAMTKRENDRRIAEI